MIHQKSRRFGATTGLFGRQNNREQHHYLIKIELNNGGAAIMHCTTCDTVNTADAQYCRSCGATLGPAPVRYATAAAPVTGPDCPVCGKSNPTGARYCVFCASPLTATYETPVPAGYMPAASAVSSFNYAPSQVMPYNTGQTMNLLVRAVWFLMIGWWLGLLWMIAAWLFNITLIGLPVGLMMLNTLPQVTTLQSLNRAHHHSRGSYLPQHPLMLRAVWFVLVGWWASLLWSIVAWSFCVSILLMPLAFWMIDRVPTVTTLAMEP